MNNSLGDFTILEKLNDDLTGEAYLAEHRFFKNRVYLCPIPTSLASDKELVRRLQAVAKNISTISSQHVIKIHSIFSTESGYAVAYDRQCLASSSTVTLKQYLTKNYPLAEDTIAAIALQIAEALDAIHDQQVDGSCLYFGSFDLSNVIIVEDEKISAYLSGFGFSELFNGSYFLKKLCQKIQSSENDKASCEALYDRISLLAPEYRFWTVQEPQDAVAADVYNFGALLYTLFFQRSPQGILSLPSSLSCNWKYGWDEVLTSCLQSNPKLRPLLLTKLIQQSIKGKEQSLQEQERNLVPKELKPKLTPQPATKPQFDPDPGAAFQTESLVVRYQPSLKQISDLDPIPTDMVVIKGGSFLRGSNQGARDESPQHEIVLPPFAVDLHPVTNEQFVRFLEVMGGEKDNNNNDMIRLRDSRIKRSSGKLLIESGYSHHPVVGVTWYGATAYARWIGKRLPTEAEWEIAAKGNDVEALYPTGSTIERTQANFFSADTTSVMSYPPNGYGLFDMAGNVYEWCNDWYDYHYYNHSVLEPVNPKGPPQGVYRVLRGGCWKSLKEDLRCSHRHRNNPGVMNGTYGFRCVADVEEE